MSSKAGIVHQAHIQETQYSYFSKKPAFSKSLIRSMNWTMEALTNKHENTKLTSNDKLVESHATVDRSFLPKLYAKVIMGRSQLHIQPLSQTANGAKTGDQMENYKNRLRNIIKTENTNSSINELKSDFENDLDDYVEIKVERPFEDRKTPLDKARERLEEGHREVTSILQSPGEWMASVGRVDTD
ncbi:unnamed protein product, partial [Diamesa serratosioi]